MHSRPRCAIAAIGSHDLILGMTASALRADDPLITLASFNVGWLSGWWRCATDCATSPASGGGGPVPAHCSITISPSAGPTLPPCRATPVRSTPTSRWPRPSPPGGPKPGWGSSPAARAFGLDFVPIAKEPYDLVLRTSMLENKLVAPVWALLERADFRVGWRRSEVTRAPRRGTGSADAGLREPCRWRGALGCSPASTCFAHHHPCLRSAYCIPSVQHRPSDDKSHSATAMPRECLP